jgi:MscS family membrane protein
VLSEIRRVLSDNPKIETRTIRVRLSELTPSALNVQLFCYVMTREYNEFAAVREEVLLNIMNLVEDSGASLASSSQTLYLSPDPTSPKQKKATESKEALSSETNRARLDSALHDRSQDDVKNAKSQG